MSENNQSFELPNYNRSQFVGREKELKKVEEILTNNAHVDNPKERVFAFVGEVGTGKTWLLNRISDQIKDAEASAIIIDLSKYQEDPEVSTIEILAEIHLQLTGNKTIQDENLVDVSRCVMEVIQDYSERETIGLLLDHVYESNWDLLAYIDQYILSPFAAIHHTLIVLAGRGRSYPWKTPEIPFQDPHVLDKFDDVATMLQVEKQVPSPILNKEKIYNYSSGIPMQNYFLALLGFPEGLEMSLKRIFQSVDEPAQETIRKYLEALCTLKSFDEEKISWMLGNYSGQELSHIQARDIREKLVRYGFAKWNEKFAGYILDESVRLTISNLLQYKDPQKWGELHSVGMSYMEDLKRRYANLPILPVEQAASHHIHEAYFSVLATPELIGREVEISKIEEFIQDQSQSYILYIHGPGGVGKTRLLKELVKYFGNVDTPQNLIAATDLVDLFHTFNRTDIGIVKRISDVLDPSGEAFQSFYIEREKYLRSISQGSTLSRKPMLSAFLADVNSLSKSQRIVLFLDTAEQFFYKDPASVKMDIKDQYLVGQGWIFKELLPKLNNSVIIIAGRTEEEDVKKSLNRALENKHYETISLRGLNQNETFKYFDEIAFAAGKGELVTISALLDGITLDQRKSIYLSLRDADLHNQLLNSNSINSAGVRPLWLSLVVDYLITQGDLPDLKNLKIPDELIHTALTANRPGRELIPYVGLTVKGATDELLGRITEKVIGSPWNQEYAAAYINSKPFSNLSFVKARREGNTIFINFHDEIYEWIKNNFELFVEKIDHRNEVFEIIRRYYNGKIDLIEEDLARFGLSDDKTYPEASERENKASSLRQYRLDAFYYQLIHTRSAEEAFDAYFVASEDALGSGDVSLESMITAEMQSHISVSKNKFKVQLNDRVFEDINAADAALRWLKRALYHKGAEDPKAIVKLIQGVIASGDSLVQVEFNVWRGLLETRGGNHINARNLLLDAKDSLVKISESKRRNTILGKTYTFLGYLARISGLYNESVAFYMDALDFWRKTGIKSLEAEVRNNLAFVYAELGDLDKSYNMAWDAYQLRLTGGDIPVGLSLNTIANIYIRDDQPEKAAIYAEQALKKFRVVGDMRGEGLAHVVLAEAERRQIENSSGSIDVEKILKKAIFHGEQGVRIFAERDEPDRQIEALIETGCAYRDLAKLQRDHLEKESALTCERQSEVYLERANNLAAQKGVKYRQIDAMVNRAWLKYYIQPLQDKNEVEAILKEVEEMIGIEYLVKPDGSFRDLPKEEIVSPYLLYLGKAELLRGQIVFARWQKSQDELAEKENKEYLNEITRHYAKSLCYNNRFSEMLSRSSARTKRRIYERCKQLNPDELQIIVEASIKNQFGGRNLLFELLRGYALVRR